MIEHYCSITHDTLFDLYATESALLVRHGPRINDAAGPLIEKERKFILVFLIRFLVSARSYS